MEQNRRTFEGIKIYSKKITLVIQPAYWGSAIYVSRSVYYFEWKNSAIHRLDLDENEKLEAVEEIGRQPGYIYR